MRMLLRMIAIFLFLFGAVRPLHAQEASFSFYGLQFGISRQTAGEIMPIDEAGLVAKPGHGMVSLELRFDRQDLLMEISASYAKPEGAFEAIALKRALNEKFVAPVHENYPNIDVVIDEYANRSAFTVIFSSRGIREENIEHYKKEFLKLME